MTWTGTIVTILSLSCMLLINIVMIRYYRRKWVNAGTLKGMTEVTKMLLLIADKFCNDEPYHANVYDKKIYGAKCEAITFLLTSLDEKLHEYEQTELGEKEEDHGYKEDDDKTTGL